MLNKKVLSDISIKRSSSGKIDIKYKGKSFIAMSDKVLFEFILDVAPMSFINDLKGFVQSEKSEIPKGVHTLITAYSFKFLEYSGKKPSSVSDMKVKEYADRLIADKKTLNEFKKAILIMREYQIKDCFKFIDMQKEGLKFVNDGKGVFPKPNQLSTTNAISRILEFDATNLDKSENKKIDKPKQYWFFKEDIDGELGLNTNEKYNEALELIKEKRASMDCALYAKKCFASRRDGKTYKPIEDYIKTISN